MVASKWLIKYGLVASVFISLSLPAQAAIRADSCPLGQTCELGAGKMVYVPVTDQDGPNYKCSIRAKEEGKDIVIRFSEGKDFEFSSTTKKIGVEGTDVNIKGKFKRIPAEGQIKMTNMSLNDGYGSCSKSN